MAPNFTPKFENNSENKEKETIGYILNRAKELEPEIINNYQDIHENPELGGQEFKTSAKIKQYLEELGIEIVTEKIGVPVDKEKGGTGIIARIKGKLGGPMIALRADMDALPIQESSDHQVRSKKDGVMHACGHDSHSAGLMGAAKILKELADQNKLDGNIILLFQPSEERTSQRESGAVQMVKSLEKTGLRTDIKAFLGLHVLTELPGGTIKLREGTETASTSNLEINLEAPGGHIMNAYQYPNLKDIVARLTLNLNNIFRKYYEEGETLVASSETKFKDASQNTLASSVTDSWIIRSLSENYKGVTNDAREKITTEIQRAIDEHLVELENTRQKEDKEKFDPKKIKVEIVMHPGYRPTVHRDPSLIKTTQESAQTVIGKDMVINNSPLMGAEDFSFYLEELQNKQIPGVFMLVGAANPEKDIPIGPHHNPNFKIDPKIVKDLSAIYAVGAVKFIESLKDKS